MKSPLVSRAWRGHISVMRHHIFRFAVLSLLTLFGWSAYAQGFSAQDKVDIQRVEQYFNGLTTVRSTFLPVSYTHLTLPTIYSV